jgi:hypothetical protein
MYYNSSLYICTKLWQWRVNHMAGCEKTSDSNLNPWITESLGHIVTRWLKGRTVVQEEISIARLQEPKEPAITKQRLCKHVPTATNTPAEIEELLESRHTTIKTMATVFSMWPNPSLHDEVTSGPGPQVGLGTKIDWPTHRRS